jgi:hypothetical protein
LTTFKIHVILNSVKQAAALSRLDTVNDTGG